MSDGGYCDFTPPIESTLEEKDPAGSALAKTRSGLDDMIKAWRESPEHRRQYAEDFEHVMGLFTDMQWLASAVQVDAKRIRPIVVRLQDHLPAVRAVRQERERDGVS